MVTVEEATRIILDHTFKSAVSTVPIEECVGHILAQTVSTDRDLPPFHRVSMDGIAVNYDNWAAGARNFPIEGSQAAGQPARTLEKPEHCIEVMTGAVLPLGCDTVIRYEDINIQNGLASVTVDEIQQGQSVHRQGMDAKKGEVLLSHGQSLAPSEIALLASVGKTHVDVYRFPRTAIISTGDELVAIDETPQPWQIRRSNSYAIQAALREMGCDATCYHLSDDRSMLIQGLKKIGMDHDLLILSGGVSKGKYDYVPEALNAIGVRKLFHQVSQRPGKPLWFGAGDGKIAFALPGNPVSTFMCFYRYIRPWLLKSLGSDVQPAAARLGKDVTFSPSLTYFLQVAVKNEDGVLVAYPVPGGGSGDFANLKNVNGFLELPPEKTDFKAGEVFPLVSFRR